MKLKQVKAGYLVDETGGQHPESPPPPPVPVDTPPHPPQGGSSYSDRLGNLLGGSKEVFVTSSSGGVKGSKGTGFAHIPPWVLLELGEHYGDGAAKYPSDPDGLSNFWKGYSIQLNIEAFFRHFLLWLGGEELIQDDGSDDPTIGNHHLSAAIWHLIDMRTKAATVWDDRPSVALQNRENQ